MKRKLQLMVLLCGLAATSLPAQYAAPPPTPAYQELSTDQLDQLLGPIALYPDPLIAQILPASTLPTQIVMADRYISGGGDPNQIDQQPWDTSVQGLAHYPNVLKWMDDNLNWTTELGQAFLNQQQDVMDSVQRLRARAQSLGNLQSTSQQQVVDDDGTIDIDPTDPDVVYVPNYAPDTVYYQTPYGTPFITFGVGFPIGIWLNHDFDWHHHNVIVFDHDHPRPANWWHERPAQHNVVFNQHPAVWHPVNHPAGGVVNRGDRGWEDRSVVHATTPIVTHPVVAPREEPHPVATHQAPPVARPEPTPVQRVEPVSRPAPNNAFIGIQSSRDTRTFSERGQQSMQEVIRPAPVSHPAPVVHSAPSGGGRPAAPQQRR